MMMKFFFPCIISATIFLSSCASVNGPGILDDADHGDHNDNGDNGYEVDFGKPIPNQDRKIEERGLTDEMVAALGVPNAISVLAFDLQGNPVEFTAENAEFIEKDVIYPAPAMQIGNVYTTTYVWFEGSHCIDVIDSVGRSYRICTPPHP